MSAQAEYQSCSHEVIGGLVEVVNIAVMDQFPTSRVDIDDVEDLLVALRTLRPKVDEFDLFIGFAQIVRGKFRDAADTFGTLVAKSLCMPDSRAMQVYCMSRNENSDWHIAANELLESEQLTPVARTMILAVKARHEIVESKMTFLSTGEFVEPESLRILKEETQPDGILPAGYGMPTMHREHDHMAVMQGQYMRL